MNDESNKAVLIINQSHNLFPMQHRLLDLKFGDAGWEYLSVPPSGWSADEQRSKLAAIPIESPIVFLSPLPLMLRDAARQGRAVFVFHNNRRTTRSVKDGMPSPPLEEEGWQIL